LFIKTARVGIDAVFLMVDSAFIFLYVPYSRRQGTKKALFCRAYCSFDGFVL